MRHIVTPLILSLLAALTACATRPDSAPATEVLKETHVAQVTQLAGTTEKRLRCYKGDGTLVPECNLRLYEIMVESFVDGDPKHDFNTGFGTSHHKGDLQGIIQSLDYIQDLGVNAIWITPIFESSPIDKQSDLANRLDATGYYASNFFAIDPKFGTLEQARRLVDEAHRRGIYVFFDGVFGHFKRNIQASPQGLLPVGKAVASPIRNLRQAEYPQSLPFFQEVAAYWIKELKIDGWRLDVAYEVPVEYWDDLRTTVQEASRAVSYTNAQGKTVNPLGYMVAEIWDGTGSNIARQGFGTDKEPALPSAFDFPSRYALVQTLGIQENIKEPWATGHPASRLNYGFDRFDKYPAHAMPNLMLGNHDLVRFGDLLQRGRFAEPEQEGYWARHRAALSFLTAYSGPITLYYGEEIGQQLGGFADPEGEGCELRGVCDDHVARISARLSGFTAQESALRDHVRTLMQLRAAHPALSMGSRTHVHSDSHVYVDLKTFADQRVLYLLNTQPQAAQVQIDAALLAPASGMSDLVGGQRIELRDGRYTIDLPPLSARFLGL